MHESKSTECNLRYTTSKHTDQHISTQRCMVLVVPHTHSNTTHSKSLCLFFFLSINWTFPVAGRGICSHRHNNSNTYPDKEKCYSYMYIKFMRMHWFFRGNSFPHKRRKEKKERDHWPPFVWLFTSNSLTYSRTQWSQWFVFLYTDSQDHRGAKGSEQFTESKTQTHSGFY